MIAFNPEFDWAVIGDRLAIYCFWLSLASVMISPMIPKGSPAVRAAACVGSGMAMSFALVAGRNAFDLGAIIPQSIGWGELIVHLGAPMIVFLAGWWWFRRRRIPYADIEEIFE